MVLKPFSCQVCTSGFGIGTGLVGRIIWWLRTISERCQPRIKKLPLSFLPFFQGQLERRGGGVSFLVSLVNEAAPRFESNPGAL